MSNVKQITEDYLRGSRNDIESYQLKLLAGQVTGMKTTFDMVAEYVVEHLNGDCQFVMKSEDAADELGISKSQMSRAMQSLSHGKTPFMERIGKSCYQINPAVIEGIKAVNAERGKK